MSVESAAVRDRAETPVAGGAWPALPHRRLAQHLREGVLRYLGVLLALSVLVVWLSATQPQFLTWGNVLNILDANAALLTVAVGVTFVMLIGGFDLSVGGMLALSGVGLATLVQADFPTGVAIALVVVGAALAALVFNGVLIARIGLSFFVVTLGTGSLLRGLALVKTKGSTQALYDNRLMHHIGSGHVAGIPISAVVALVVLGAALCCVRFTGFGRQLYVVGGNAEAARFAGINVAGVRIAAYAIAGLCAGIAGVLTSARLAAAAPDAGQGIELTAAAAVLIGGTSLAGGSGGLFGSMLGVLFLGVLSNGLTLAGISSFWQGVVTGVVLVLAVLFDRFRPKPVH